MIKIKEKKSLIMVFTVMAALVLNLFCFSNKVFASGSISNVRISDEHEDEILWDEVSGAEGYSVSNGSLSSGWI